MCKCIKCKKHCDCGEKYCEQCLTDEIRKDNTEKDKEAKC